jgi:hypothetical protein
VQLNFLWVEQRGDKLVLHAMEEMTQYLEKNGDTYSKPQVMGGRTSLDFVFSVAAVESDSQQSGYGVRIGPFRYTLLKSISEPQVFDTSDDSTFCCFPEEEKYLSEPLGPPLKDGPAIKEKADSERETKRPKKKS